MLFSHNNISTPLPQPEFLVNNAVPPGQAIKLDWLDRRPSALARDQVPKRHLSATPHSLGSRALPSRRPEAQGRGTIGDDVRDATNRVPILWFQKRILTRHPSEVPHRCTGPVRRCRATHRRRSGRWGGDRRRQQGAVDHRHRRPGRQQGLCRHVSTTSPAGVMPAALGKRAGGRLTNEALAVSRQDPLRAGVPDARPS